MMTASIRVAGVTLRVSNMLAVQRQQILYTAWRCGCNMQRIGGSFLRHQVVSKRQPIQSLNVRIDVQLKERTSQIEPFGYRFAVARCLLLRWPITSRIFWTADDESMFGERLGVSPPRQPRVIKPHFQNTKSAVPDRGAC